MQDALLIHTCVSWAEMAGMAGGWLPVSLQMASLDFLTSCQWTQFTYGH